MYDHTVDTWEEGVWLDADIGIELFPEQNCLASFALVRRGQSEHSQTVPIGPTFSTEKCKTANYSLYPSNEPANSNMLQSVVIRYIKDILNHLCKQNVQEQTSHLVDIHSVQLMQYCFTIL